ncbi:MAG: aminoacyl-tRNA hydrolase [Firmicutes bacterium]|nr:aminoacyl-tRNA hydrolase [Bacillota bacterium]MDH7495407.1 aminoacyl-tRNA hydrolase [Bacillota bacterium]
MKLIVGLGNPGSQYEGSRHNVGFLVVDFLAKRHGIRVAQRRFHALLGQGEIRGEQVIVAKPITYMNRSGYAVRAIADWYGAAPSEILVIVDDMALEPGRIRMRPKGSDGGHKGLRSIISLLGCQDFPRLRVGIGRPGPSEDAAGYVLGWFTREELAVMLEAFDRAADAVEAWIASGVDEAMNMFNG